MKLIIVNLILFLMFSVFLKNTNSQDDIIVMTIWAAITALSTGGLIIVYVLLSDIGLPT